MYNKNMERFVENRKIKIREQDEYITLQNALKIENIIQTGGMAKLFLSENNVLVNSGVFHQAVVQYDASG